MIIFLTVNSFTWEILFLSFILSFMTLFWKLLSFFISYVFFLHNLAFDAKHIRLAVADMAFRILIHCISKHPWCFTDTTPNSYGVVCNFDFICEWKILSPLILFQISPSVFLCIDTLKDLYHKCIRMNINHWIESICFTFWGKTAIAEQNTRTNVSEVWNEKKNFEH